jgi:predicted transcriptional regulator
MHPKYQEAIKLRFKGEGYGTIAKSLGVSKSSVSGWCKNLKLPRAIQKIIEAKTKASHTQLAFYNQQKHQRVQEENKKIREETIKQISSLSKNDLLLIGATLFWAEGYKRAEYLRSPYVSFSNSDPDMVALFMRFLREILKVSEEKFTPYIHIHPNVNETKAINFWAKTAHIPKKKFRITRQVSRASKGKRPFNSLPYGTIDIRVRSRQNFYQIRGLLDGLIKNIC